MKRKWVRAAAGTLFTASVLWMLPFFTSEKDRAAQAAEPVFSKESGCYDEGFDLSLSAPEGSTIYYTTDGSIPLAKEDAGQDATPTPVPTPTEKPVEFDLSVANTDYVYNVSMNETEEGTQLAFAWRYRSMCFRVPQGETDWTKYKTLRIEFSVDEAADGEQVGLQACPIYANAPDSYGDNGQYRCFEARMTSEAGAKNEVWEISLAGRDVSEVGWIMLGTTTNAGHLEPPDTITVHRIQLVRDMIGGEPDEKMDTIKYSSPIKVKNRAGEPNVLASKNNTALMYNSSYATLYTPKADEVAKATVIRALAVDKEGKRSKVVTKTYFVGNDLAHTYKNASVMSIVTDPDNLLSRDKGIYRKENYENSGKSWERPASVEYFEEDGTIPFATEMGIRLHGGWSRHYGQKSFNLYFREDYGGLKNLRDYELIPGALDAEGKPITKYKSVMLRNGGNDTEYTKLQDVWIQSLVRDRNFATQAAKPCVLFLNGEYWGIYNLTEKYSDNSLEEEFGVQKDNIIVIKDNELDEGKKEDFALYEQLMDLASLDMTKEENYEKFCSMVDVQSYIDYYATEVYIGNYDWPEKNVQLWRAREKDGTPYGDTKWRFILHDTEYSMGLYGSSTGDYPLTWLLSRDDLFARVFENEQFKKQFNRTMCDLFNVNFESTHAVDSLEQYSAIYKPLMEDYFVRFGLNASDFGRNVSRMRKFVQERRLTVLKDLKAHADAGSHTVLTVKGMKDSIVTVNTTEAKLKDGQWSGTYFKSTPVVLTAPPVEGYEFIGWKLTNAETVREDGMMIQVMLHNKPVVEALYRQEGFQNISPGPSVNETVKLAKVKKLKVTSKRKRALKISWKKVKKADGYQIVLATNRKFTKNRRKISTTSVSKTVKSLRSGKKYYIKVRAFRRTSKGKQYGAYSLVKEKKVK